MPLGSNLSDEERNPNMTERGANKAKRLSFLARRAYFFEATFYEHLNFIRLWRGYLLSLCHLGRAICAQAAASLGVLPTALS